MKSTTRSKSTTRTTRRKTTWWTARCSAGWAERGRTGWTGWTGQRRRLLAMGWWTSNCGWTSKGWSSHSRQPSAEPTASGSAGRRPATRPSAARLFCPPLPACVQLCPHGRPVADPAAGIDTAGCQGGLSLRQWTATPGGSALPTATTTSRSGVAGSSSTRARPRSRSCMPRPPSWPSTRTAYRRRSSCGAHRARRPLADCGMTMG